MHLALANNVATAGGKLDNWYAALPLIKLASLSSF